jgi:hypothetical protein
MARPQKEGIDYFPVDTVMDDEVDLIEAEYGLIGFAVLIKLYQKIYKHGYYYPWTEKELLLFSKKISVDRNTVASIVSDCIKWDLFSKKMYETYSILTSRGIQKRYINAIYKRTAVEVYKEYLLVDVSGKKNITLTKVSDIRNEDTSIVSDSKSTQSKVNKIKVKDKKICGQNFIPPTLEQVKEYCRERNNSVNADKWHDFYTAKNWMIGKNKMKDWKAAVRTWEKNSKQQGKRPAQSGNYSQRKYENAFFNGLYTNLDKKGDAKGLEKGNIKPVAGQDD